MNSGATNKPIVLVVEDDPINRTLLAEVCRAEGYEVHTADDGEAALRIFTAGPVDLMLVDAAMPRMDGFVLCRIVRDVREVPVIMVSAAPEDNAREKALQAGVSVFVSKPFRVFELARHMRVALAARRPPSEPPSARGRRRACANVLDTLGTTLRLRGVIRDLLDEGPPVVCLLLRLEGEQQVIDQMGQLGRDAVMGVAARQLMQALGTDYVFWAESNELVGLEPGGSVDALVGAVQGAVEEVKNFGIEGIQFRYGIARCEAGGPLDADVMLQAARRAVDEATRRGEAGHVNGTPRSPSSASSA
ncbi:MAG: response regulator [Polyangiaceae bacterium]|nr:response regulator [Polyangiaceae bacterium]